MDLQKEKKPWKRMRFKTNKVWLALDPEGQPLVQKNKVLIKYQLDQDYEYWVNPQSVQPLEAVDPNANRVKNGPVRNNLKKSETTPVTDRPRKQSGPDIIEIFTDGASSGNPGPSGIGVVWRFGKHEKEFSKHIGFATNNIAELEAIRTALVELKKTDLPIRIFTDSRYAHGVLVLGWKAKKNKALVESIRELILKFADIKIIPVKGHQGIPGNERADQLATAAIPKAAKK